MTVGDVSRSRRPAGEVGAWLRVALAWLAPVALALLGLWVIFPAVGGRAVIYNPVMGAVQVAAAAGVLIAVPDLRRLLRPRWWWVPALAIHICAVVLRHQEILPARSAAVAAAGFWFLTVGLWEEVVFRGYIWRQLESVLSSQRAILMVTSLLFLLAHAPNWALGGFELVTAVFQLIWGVIFGLLRTAGQGLALPIWAHALLDVIGST